MGVLVEEGVVVWRRDNNITFAKGIAGAAI